MRLCWDINCTIITVRNWACLNYIYIYLETADTIDERNITVRNESETSSHVHIRWSDPPVPNGLIITYELEMHKMEAAHVSVIQGWDSSAGRRISAFLGSFSSLLWLPQICNKIWGGGGPLIKLYSHHYDQIDA